MKKRNKKSITSIVREIIFTRPCILESIVNNYANYSALSRLLYDDVSKYLKKKDIKLSTIKISLIRISEKLRGERKNTEKIIKDVIANSSLTIIDGIDVITIRHISLKQLQILLKIFEKSRFYHFTQGIGQITIMTDYESYREILKIFSSDNILNVLENQSAVILTSPKNIIYTPGVIAYLSSLLSIRKINITQMISCHTDTIFVVSRNNALEVFKLLQDVIEKFRKSDTCYQAS
ncbi:MAG: ACT domain-containing protein [Thermoprotei archaeon]|nr:MAG: ACT domain-containing protein [Thermoprotei archaeon]